MLSHMAIDGGVGGWIGGGGGGGGRRWWIPFYKSFISIYILVVLYVWIMLRYFFEVCDDDYDGYMHFPFSSCDSV